jgi:hypothetical protein
VRVAGGDDREPVAVVLHALEQLDDRLGAEVALAVGAHETVGLVEEQHAVERAVDDGGGLRRRLADVARDEVLARDLDDAVARQQPEALVEAPEQPRDGGLAGAGAALEDEVQRDLHGLQAGGPAQRGDPQQLGQAVDLGLDRGEADQRIELGEHRVVAGLVEAQRRRIGRGRAGPALGGGVGAGGGRRRSDVGGVDVAVAVAVAGRGRRPVGPQRVERLARRSHDLLAAAGRRVLGHLDRGAQARLGVGAAREPAQRLGAREVRVGDRIERRPDRGGQRDRLVERRQRTLVLALV